MAAVKSSPPPHTVLLCMVLVVLVGMMLLVAACTPAGDPPAEPAGTTTTATATTATARPECRQVADDLRALATAVRGLATGETTVDDVRSAANSLAASFDEARSAVGPDARASLDQAGQALEQLQAALGTRPLDTGALRQAADDLTTALGGAVAVCAGSSATGAPTS